MLVEYHAHLRELVGINRIDGFRERSLDPFINRIPLVPSSAGAPEAK
jgi:hypothetical protein